MRILHLTNHCEEAGNGIVNVAVDLACLQAQFGHEVAYASVGGSYVGLLNRYGIEHFTMQSFGTTDLNLRHALRRPHYFVRALIDMKRILRQYRPDVIHAHMVTGALAAFATMPRRGTRLVTSVHNVEERKALAMAVGHRVIAVSREVACILTRRGIPPNRLRVVCNGPLGSPRSAALPDAGDGQMDPTAIVTVAGLYARKRVDDLIRAFHTVSQEFPQTTLHILGDGPERANLERQARELGLEGKVRFWGFISDPRPHMRKAGIFVLPSRAESFPLVIAEARAMGCAVIATDVGGVSEALDGGTAGILVPPVAPDVLAKEIARLLRNRTELKAWRDLASRNLDWLHCERLARETLLVYDDALRDAVERRGSKSTHRLFASVAK